MEIATPIQLAGLGLLVGFAGTFGLRWAVLVLGLVLLLIGFALSGITVTVKVPHRAPKPPPGDPVGDHQWTS